MIKKLLFSTLIVVLFAACASHSKTIRDIELGMSKQQVVSIMGKGYISESSVQHPDGNVEIISYTSSAYDASSTLITTKYILHFLNGKLVEWYRDENRPHPRPHRPQP